MRIIPSPELLAAFPSLAFLLRTAYDDLGTGVAPSPTERHRAQVAYDVACGVGGDPETAPVTRRTGVMVYPAVGHHATRGGH